MESKPQVKTVVDESLAVPGDATSPFHPRKVLGRCSDSDRIGIWFGPLDSYLIATFDSGQLWDNKRDPA